MADEHKFLEIETKYDAGGIDRIKFKALAAAQNPTSFLYVESRDVYYVKSETEFLRYRMPCENDTTKRSELTFKKKHANGNNIVRTEVNLRVDQNNEATLTAFCEGLGYTRNFSVLKFCDIYYFDDADMVYYSVTDDNGKVAHFLEIEVNEELQITEDQAWEIIEKYEKILTPLGITAKNRKKLSLYEMYRVEQK